MNKREEKKSFLSNVLKRYMLPFVFLILFVAHSGLSITNHIQLVKKFVSAQGDYNTVRSKFSNFRDIYRISQLVPEYSKIQYTNKRWEYRRVAARYVLYPRELSENWSYLIDEGDSAQNIPSEWFKVPISSRISVYAKGGINFFHQPRI